MLAEAPPRVNEFNRFRRVFLGQRRSGIWSGCNRSLYSFIAIFAPFIAPYDPFEPDLSAALTQPNTAHLLGTDALGRDTLSRIILRHADLLNDRSDCGRQLPAMVGMTLGTLAGYLRGMDQYHHHEVH